MIRKFVLLSAVALAGMSLADLSVAGERRGDGGWTPIGTYAVIAAICAFSGLEDHQHGDEPAGPVVPGETQTPHSVDGQTNPPGVASVCQFLNPGRSN